MLEQSAGWPAKPFFGHLCAGREAFEEGAGGAGQGLFVGFLVLGGGAHFGLQCTYN